MKKLLLALSLILGSYVYGESIIAVKPLDPTKFDNNFYVGRVGFYLPQENFLEVTKEYFLVNDAFGLKHFSSNALHDVLQNKDVKPMLSIKAFIPKGEEHLKVELAEIEGHDKNKPESYFACLQYLNVDCVADILAFKSVVQQNIQNNRILLDRLYFLLQTTDHIEPIFASNMSISGNNYPLGSLYRIYALSLSEAVVNIDDGKIEKGLEQLQLARKRIDLTYHPKSKPLLFDLSAIISETQALDQVMNGLLNSGLLNDSLNNSLLEEILQPYSLDALLTIQKSLLFEIRDAIWTNYRAYLMHDIDIVDDSIVLTEENEYILLSMWKESEVALSPAFEERFVYLSDLSQKDFWKDAQNLNQLNEQIAKVANEITEQNIGNIENVVLKGISSNLDEIAALQNEYNDLIHSKQLLLEGHIKSLKYDPYVLFIYLNDKYPSDQRIKAMFAALDQMDQAGKDGIVINAKLYQDILNKHNVIREDFIEYEALINRFKVQFLEQQNYHRLVYLKYLIMKNNISADNIPEFLASMGDLAKNIMTKEPYQFDKHTHMLWTPLPDNQYVPSLIRSARWQNYDVCNYEVYVPNL